MRVGKFLNIIETLILCICFVLIGKLCVGYFEQENVFDINKKTTNTNVQFAVDSFVSKNYIQPVKGDKVESCLIPKKLKTENLKDYLGSDVEDSNNLYFLDYYGKVWTEKKDRLLTVTEQDGFIVFNNTGAVSHRIYEIKNNNCKNINELAMIKFGESENLYFKIIDPNNSYLIQPIYSNGREGVPVGVGFDGRLYQ